MYARLCYLEPLAEIGGYHVHKTQFGKGPVLSEFEILAVEKYEVHLSGNQ